MRHRSSGLGAHLVLIRLFIISSSTFPLFSLVPFLLLIKMAGEFFEAGLLDRTFIGQEAVKQGHDF
jgi:hypothetical protein